MKCELKSTGKVKKRHYLSVGKTEYEFSFDYHLKTAKVYFSDVTNNVDQELKIDKLYHLTAGDYQTTNKLNKIIATSKKDEYMIGRNKRKKVIMRNNQVIAKYKQKWFTTNMEIDVIDEKYLANIIDLLIIKKHDLSKLYWLCVVMILIVIITLN